MIKYLGHFDGKKINMMKVFIASNMIDEFACLLFYQVKIRWTKLEGSELSVKINFLNML